MRVHKIEFFDGSKFLFRTDKPFQEQVDRLIEEKRKKLLLMPHEEKAPLIKRALTKLGGLIKVDLDIEISEEEYNKIELVSV